MNSNTNKSTGVSTEKPAINLTVSQKANIKRNREKALLLRQSKIVDSNSDLAAVETNGGVRAKVRKVVDTGGGFLLDVESDLMSSGNSQTQLASKKQTRLVHPAAPVINPGDLVCQECLKPFNDSFLFSKFDLPVCDSCRDNSESHRLVTRSTAKSDYLLTDVDLDKREPILRYTLRRNPHNPRWGDMRLYLEGQIAQRCLEVWGSEEGLEAERTRRAEKRDAAKEAKYNKGMKELRMKVRSSLYHKKSDEHVHEFGPETYSEETDMYCKTCEVCNHTQTYEKM